MLDVGRFNEDRSRMVSPSQHNNQSRLGSYFLQDQNKSSFTQSSPLLMAFPVSVHDTTADNSPYTFGSLWGAPTSSIASKQVGLSTTSEPRNIRGDESTIADWKVVGSPPRPTNFERRMQAHPVQQQQQQQQLSKQNNDFRLTQPNSEHTSLSSEGSSILPSDIDGLLPSSLHDDAIFQDFEDVGRGRSYSDYEGGRIRSLSDVTSEYSMPPGHLFQRHQYNQHRSGQYESDDNPMSYLFSTSPPLMESLLETINGDGYTPQGNRVSDTLDDFDLNRQMDQLGFDEYYSSSMDNKSYMFGPSSAPSGSASSSGLGSASAPMPINVRSYMSNATSPPNSYYYGDSNALDGSHGAMSLPELGPMRGVEYYHVEFKSGRTASYYVEESKKQKFKLGDLVLVEADRGKDLGKIVDKGVHCTDRDAKPIVRLAHPPEIAQLSLKAQDEARALALCQSKIRQKKLMMEVVEAEYQWDRRKLTYFFIADRRIDFRELVRELFKVYKTRIWMCSVEEKSVKKLTK